MLNFSNKLSIGLKYERKQINPAHFEIPVFDIFDTNHSILTVIEKAIENQRKYSSLVYCLCIIFLSVFIIFSCTKDQESNAPELEPESQIMPGMEVFNPGGRVFYLDNQLGNDTNDGLVPERAWKTLLKASTSYTPGDWILLRAGQTFLGQLSLSNVEGQVDNPIKIGVFDSSDSEELARINCSGQTSGIELSYCSHIEVDNIEIFGDGGGTSPDRRGVHCARWGNSGPSEHLHFKNLYIHDLFAPTPSDSDGKKETLYQGTAFQFSSPNTENAHYRDIRIENCRVENIGTHAIVFHKWPNENQLASATFHEGIDIIDNNFDNLGGDGIVTAGCKDVYIARNSITRPGSFDDQRMKGRGDGLWTWYTNGAIVEYNYLSGARGRIDCSGMHVDIGSQNNIFQYNLSTDNEGGFCKIIGDSYNNVYRYNVSINDGARKGGVNEFGRKKVDGLVLLLSGYMADRLGQNVKKGPYNSYIYNNTIYTNASIEANFSVDHTAKGALIANNLFIIEGNAKDISWRRPEYTGNHENIVFRNNRTVTGKTTVPNDSLNINHAWDSYLDNLGIDPQLANSGGSSALDYLPGNQSDIKDQGIDLYLLPGDVNGVSGGFIPSKGDHRGTIINGLPDIGALEIE